MAGASRAGGIAADLRTGPRHRGLWRQAFQRLRRNRVAAVSAAVLAIICLMAVLTEAIPAVERYRPSDQQFEQVQSGPTREHWLGTDNLGRDTWARAWEGVRISLKIAIGAQVLVLAVGLTIGVGAALGGRWVDGLLMRFTDLMYAFPDLLAIIIMRAVLSEREWPILGSGDPQIPGLPGPILQMILAIAFVGWVTLARLVRGQMLGLRETEFVLAARASGASPLRVAVVHMLPNTLGPVIVAVTFGIPTAIFAESVLGFIGISLPPPAASLGTLVSDGYRYYRVNPWLLCVPSAVLATLMLCFTFLGDGLRDALDPRTRG